MRIIGWLVGAAIGLCIAGILYVIVAGLVGGLPGVTVDNGNPCQYGGTGKTSAHPLTGVLRDTYSGDIYLRCEDGESR